MEKGKTQQVRASTALLEQIKQNEPLLQNTAPHVIVNMALTHFDLFLKGDPTRANIRDKIQKATAAGNITPAQKIQLETLLAKVL